MKLTRLLQRRQHSGTEYRTWLQVLHIDLILVLSILALNFFGFFILYSAGGQHLSIVLAQISHMSLALMLMFLLAQIPPHVYERLTPWFYAISLFALLLVLGIGHVSLGAQRWIGFGALRFQPSDFMLLALPMMLSWFFSHRILPPNTKEILVSLMLILVPVVLTAKEPDLGSAMLILASGAVLLLLAGISWRLVFLALLLLLLLTPIVWHIMHDYQKQRVLTFLNPARDPLGAGYHIIQSKIAIGSGGVWGKGWLAGTQSHLQFLPEHTTDFIFSVCAEEFGLMGTLFLLFLYGVILLRCFWITRQAQTTYARLLAGSLTTLFFLSTFVNIGMVSGILPVVGLPLPMISYGGTSMLTLMACFGLLMSISGHRRLLA